GVLSRWTLDGYDGTRVPGYPGFIALASSDPRLVYALQLGLGLAISFLLFWMTFRTTQSIPISLLVGLLYDLFPGQFLFEANLLAETLTTFLLTLSLSLLAGLLHARSAAAGGLWAFLLGLASALAGLARPLYFYLPVWLLFFLWSRKNGVRRMILRIAAFSVGPALLLGGWLWFIYSTYGMLSPTVLSGYGLVQHTGPYFEYLPDSAAPIRDTYVRLRDERVAERGDQTNTIWDAIPELSAASGLGFYDLSREIQRLSIQLIREHPAWYARSVAEGWIDFWKAPVYWKPEGIEASGVRSALGAWTTSGRALCILSNALFLLASIAMLVLPRVRRRLGLDAHLLATVGAVWIGSVVQTLADHGDNPRFLVPAQMLVIYVVVRMAYAWWCTSRGREARAQ
ncbi:MAG: hypothetical protein NTU91_12420, partial [Chloroflexi bacterium]|nr:hypothetical protein [Chloroflexota bacterium]